ncbi:MAG: glycosyltransferase family 9 protein [Ignavibacteriaceae bacterium]
MKIEFNNVKKILCIKPRGIGDIVLSTIVLENIKEHFPTAAIHYLTEDFAKLSVANNPFVAKILTYKKNDFILSVIHKVRKEKYDLIFDFWSNPKSAQITFLSGARHRVGFGYRGRKYAYNIVADSGRGEVHSAEHNLELLKVISIPIKSKNIQFYLNEDDKSKATKYFNETFSADDFVVGIIPSGGWASKRCDAEKLIEFCERIYSKYRNKFLILWGPGDENDATQIYYTLKNISVLAPQTTVAEMAGLIAKCNFIIANDSGPMHIAAALKVPTLGIFGPTNPKKHGPYSSNSDYIIKDDLHCIICDKLECPYDHECMKELSADLLLSKVEKILNEKD